MIVQSGAYKSICIPSPASSSIKLVRHGYELTWVQDGKVRVDWKPARTHGQGQMQSVDLKLPYVIGPAKKCNLIDINVQKNIA